MKTFALAAAAIGTVIAASPAIAGEPKQQMVIKYDDLNLSSEAGQKVLERRIEKAARDVCGLDRQQTGTRFKSRSAQKCYVEAKAKATKSFASLIENRRVGG